MSSFQIYKIVFRLQCTPQAGARNEKYMNFLRGIEQTRPESWEFSLDGQEADVHAPLPESGSHTVECVFSNIFAEAFQDTVFGLPESQEPCAVLLDADFGTVYRLYGGAEENILPRLPQDTEWESEDGIEITLCLPDAAWAGILDCDAAETADVLEEEDCEVFPMLFGEENAELLRLSEAEFDEADTGTDGTAAQYWIPSWRIFYGNSAEKLKAVFDRMADIMAKKGGFIRMNTIGAEQKNGVYENRVYSCEGMRLLNFKSAENRLFDFEAREITL